MNEKKLNTIINNSFKLKGFSHKISDGLDGKFIQNPFDGFSVLNKKAWYWETKLEKSYYLSFNFKKIEEHQLKNLLFIKKELKDKCNSLIILGYWVSYKIFDIFLFDCKLILEAILQNKKSFLKNDINKIKKKFNIPIKKGLLDITTISDIEKKIIDFDFWNN